MKLGIVAAIVVVWAGCAQAQAPRDEGNVAAAVEVLTAAHALNVLLPTSELAACQVAIDPSRRNSGNVRATASRVGLLHAGLVRGSSPLQIVRIRSPFVQQELEFLKSELDLIQPYLDFATRGTFEAAYLTVLREHRQNATSQTERVVEAISQTFMHTRVDLYESATLGALSTLELDVVTARAAICAIRLGLDEPREELGHALRDLGDALYQTSVGDSEARVLQPSPEVSGALDCVSVRLSEERGDLLQIAQGAAIDDFDIERVEAGLQALLNDVRLAARIYKAALADYPIPEVTCAQVR